jgi:hypothetical protein
MTNSAKKTLATSPPLFGSDKFYWHGYIDFYEQFFTLRNFSKIAEIGIFHGDSIRWLLHRFPQATIYGADILPIQSEWPVDARFHASQLDQENRTQLNAFFQSCGVLDLIIEDGSHQPRHQVNTLLAGLPHLQTNGIYILEDIQTSLPKHPLMQTKSNGWFKGKPKPIVGTALSALLAINHYRAINVPLTQTMAHEIARNSLLTADEILLLDQQISGIHLYRRTSLPQKCHHCGSIHYQFNQFLCVCGAEIFSDTDSMSFVLIKR